MKRKAWMLSLLTVALGASAALFLAPFNPGFSPLDREEKAFATGEPDNPRERDLWFWRQRSYPLDTIPAEVHRAVIEQELERGRRSPYLEQQGEGSWTELGPASVRGLTMGGTRQDASGRALTVALQPGNPNLVLLGTAQGGIWRSTDGGASFGAVAENQPSLAVKVIRFAPSNPSVVYAGTGEPHASTSIYGTGVLKSTDAGATWTALPAGGNGWNFKYAAVSGLQVDPGNPNMLYATTAVISPSVDHQTPPDNAKPQTGIFKSSDGGQSWVLLKAARTYGGSSQVGMMDLEMGNATLLYATEFGGGVYRTTDAGANWQLVTPLKSEQGGGGLPAPVDSYAHYIQANGRFTIYNRLRFNNTVPDFGRIEIGVSASNPNIIYAGYDLEGKMALDVNANGTFDSGTDIIASVGLLFKSTDGGQSWNWLGDWLRGGTPEYCGDQCGYDNMVVVNPENPDDVVIGGNGNFRSFWPDPVSEPTRILALPWRGIIHRTLDGGASWVDTTPHCGSTQYVSAGQNYGNPPLPAFECPQNAMDPARMIHPDIHAAAYEPGSGRVYIANDGGLARGRLVSGGNPRNGLDYRWDNLNAGLATLQFYFFDVHPTDPNIMLGGLQDNAMAYYGGQAQWESWGQGDGTIGAFDPQDPRIVYYGTQNGVYRSDRGGAKDFADPTWIEIVSKDMFQGEQVGFIPVFAVDPVQPNRVYLATGDSLYRSDNRGGAGGPDNWVRVGAVSGATAIAVSPRNNSLVWVGTSTGKIFLASGGQLVERTAAPLPGRYVSSIKASPTEANTVFVTFSGYNSNTPNTPGKVFKSTTQGETWTNVSGNLPDVPASALALDSTQAGRFWIGSDVGAFQTTDGGSTWASYRRNMPVVAIMDMKFSATTGFLTVVTHGRGAWRTRPDGAGSGEEGQVLYFPRLVNTSSEWTGIAIANPTSQRAQISYTAYASNGTPISGNGVTNPQTMALAPMSQSAQLGFQLFGNNLNVSDGWVKVASSVSGVTGFFLSFNPTLSTMDGADVSNRLLKNFLFAEPRNALISMVNPNNTTATLAMGFVDSSGVLRATVSGTLPPNGSFTGPATGLFDSSLINGGGYLAVVSNQPLAATEVFGVTGAYTAALNPMDLAGGATVLYSPQYVVGGGIWKTTLALINLENTPASVTLTLISDNGSVIGTPARGTLPAQGRLVTSDPSIFGISGTGATIEGYVRINSSTRLAGYVRFGDLADSLFQTALPLATQGRSRLIYSQVVQNETFFTGVAMLNPASQPASYTVTVFDASGKQVGSGTGPIPANGRASRLLTEIIPSLPPVSGGYFTVTTSAPVFSFGVFGTNTLSVLSAVPPQDLP